MKGTHHGPGRSTEIAAALKIGPEVKTLKDAVFSLVQAAGTYGVIPDEAWASIQLWRPGTPETSIRRRFNDLWEDGLVVRNGRVRDNRRGNGEEIWILGHDDSAVAKQRESRQKKLVVEKLRDRVTELEARLAALGQDPSVIFCIGCKAQGRSKALGRVVVEAIRSKRSVYCKDCGLRMGYADA